MTNSDLPINGVKFTKSNIKEIENQQFNKPSINKTGWPAGPWHDEPDQLQFTAHGLDCWIVRHPTQGHFCAYVCCCHDVPRKLLPEDITSHDEAIYGFKCSFGWNYSPGLASPLGDPIAYCTFNKMKRHAEGLARALQCESVWWRRVRRHLADVLHIKIRTWPKEHHVSFVPKSDD